MKYRLRKLREAKNMTQEQIAKVLNMTRTNYSKIEKEQVSLSFDDALLLAEFFDVSLEELVNSKKPRKIISSNDLKLIRTIRLTLEEIEAHYIDTKSKNESSISK